MNVPSGIEREPVLTRLDTTTGHTSVLFLEPGSRFSPELILRHERAGIECATCHQPLSFRNDSGQLTLGHWEEHVVRCSEPKSLPSPPNTADARRMRRSEAERIAYFVNDPHVGQVEPYQVLCNVCNRWIRLRSHSTYCSIPWDAHRNTCLKKQGQLFISVSPPLTSRPLKRAKYGSAPAVKEEDVDGEYELEEPTVAMPKQDSVTLTQRVAFFANDQTVKEFDENGALCAVCSGWVAFRTDNHEVAVQAWREHRHKCPPSPVESIPSRPASPSVLQPHIRLPLPDAPNITVDLSPQQYHPPHQLRQRNAEDRRARLQSDLLIRTVEPSRVFCTLCKKWVALRRDSSYCAYPWVQHRAKCLARYERKLQEQREHGSANASTNSRPAQLVACQPSPSSPSNKTIPSHPPRHVPGYALSSVPIESTNEDLIHDDSSVVQRDEQKDKPELPKTPVKRAMRLDLNLGSDRNVFVWSSIRYLFCTTHASSDELTVSSLLAYVNAALPVDKHEEFDMREVVVAVSAASGAEFVLEGDVVRPRIG
ncbi:hypothetical protein MIND_00593100 [Mycena indigotica]|uniref:Uncharacterized protein n=1 Tax=Mycena indigotica TaxID=2126181 RepID=A0A8H6SR18_9AGAR|nr:uncharacterized protein MIND_00593100 [Mycena indigotica]KAF7303638.1 hypothetical protein MIND_00593100 [Mycena indigotica]